MRQLAALLAALTVSALAAEVGPQMRDPAPGEVKLSLQIVPVGGLAVTWEPVVAVLTLANQTADSLRVSLRPDDLQLTVRDPAGKVLRAPVVPPQRPGLAIGMAIPGVFLGPHLASQPKIRLLNETCPFSAAGGYEVAVTLLSREGAAEPAVIAAAQATYTPREGTAEEYRWLASILASWQLNPLEDCPALAQGRPRPDWRNDTPLGQELVQRRADLLAWYLREEALEPLAQLAYTGDGESGKAFAGLRRLGTPRARALLEALTGSTDRSVAEQAKAALAPPEPRTTEGGVTDAQ